MLLGGCWIFYIKLSSVCGSCSHVYTAPSISITILPAKQIDLDQPAMVIFFCFQPAICAAATSRMC